MAMPVFSYVAKMRTWLASTEVLSDACFPDFPLFILHGKEVVRWKARTEVGRSTLIPYDVFRQA